MTACYTYIEDYVQSFYLKIGVSKPDDLDFKEIAARLDIQVFYWPDASQALFTSDKGFILLNEELNNQQQWQDFCHELGHVLLHVGNQRNMPHSFREYQEIKANNFMYHAAIPTFMLDQLNIKNYTPSTIRYIQQLFHVEYEFAQQRLISYIHKNFLQYKSQEVLL